MSGGEIATIAAPASFAAIALIWSITKYILDRRQRSKERQEAQLRTHFEDLRKQVMEPIWRESLKVLEQSGKLVRRPYGYTIQDLPEKLSFEEGQQFDSFKQHFPELAGKWKGLRQNIDKHNKEHHLFLQEIRRAFAEFPCVSDTIFAPLFTRWAELADKRSPWPDFRQIHIIPSPEGYALCASGWNSGWVALVRSEDEIEQYRLRIIEVAENEEYRGKAAEIHISASKLVQTLRDFAANELRNTIDEISRYWPSKKFKKLTSCPICSQKF